MNIEVSDIWNGFKDELRSFIASRVRHQADPDDVLQDVFVKVIQNQDKLAKTQNLRHYLYAMVRNATTDVFRNAKVMSDISDVDLACEEKEEVSLNELIAECCLRPFIHQLPEKYREALVEVEFENKPQKALATEKRISYSAAKSRVQRGRDKLKEMVLSCCADESDKYGNLIRTEKESCGC